MRVLTIVGARPQFIKAAPLSQALRQAGHSEYLLHTGQHYDYGMSGVFFDELGLPEPDANLGIGSGLHGWQIGQMLSRIEQTLLEQQPDWVIVFGDTNSTLAGALAARRLDLRLAHVEAGLRSYNYRMPEEQNRLLADHCADLLLCPTRTAVDNLQREGRVEGVHQVGDVMYDAVLQFGRLAAQRSTLLAELELQPAGYDLVTIHRNYNTDDPQRLEALLSALAQLPRRVIFPLHPRTRKLIDQHRLYELLEAPAQVETLPPLSYLDMLALEQNAHHILTDSGGVQKEAYFFGVPCLTLRPETEWVETVASGWNVLVDVDPERILETSLNHSWPAGSPPQVFGDGNAAQQIAALLETAIHIQAGNPGV